MPRRISSSAARKHFGAMLQWTEAHGDDLVVKRRGKPVAVLLATARIRSCSGCVRRSANARRLRPWTQRLKIAERNADLSEEEASRLAGFADEVIEETLAGNPPLMSGSAIC